MPAAALHGLALWGWHAPGLFDLAIAHEGLHRLEHASFFGTALLFWLAVLGARSPHRAGLALGAALATLVHGGLLGALITITPVPLYGWYHDRTEAWGMAQLADQQLAGLVMWVPMGTAYFAACLLLASRLVGISEKQKRQDPDEGGLGPSASTLFRRVNLYFRLAPMAEVGKWLPVGERSSNRSCRTSADARCTARQRLALLLCGALTGVGGALRRLRVRWTVVSIGRKMVQPAGGPPDPPE